MRFKNRSDAGRQLAAQLQAYRWKPEVLVLALPPGGVPVAAEIALALNAPLDVFLIRKLCVPGLENLEMAAITTGGTRVLHDDVVNYLGIQEDTIEAVTRREQRELEYRERLYRGHRPAPEVRGKNVILIDDGMSPGATMKISLLALRRQSPVRLIAALPQLAGTTHEAIDRLADEIVSLKTPESFFPDGIWYEDFRQTTEAEASRMLSEYFASVNR